jgi:hypothetical protein
MEERCRFGVLGGYCHGTVVVWSTRRVLPKEDGGHVWWTIVILGKKMSSPFPRAFTKMFYKNSSLRRI